MLIYTQEGKLACISKSALELAGYTSIHEFLEEHEDYSELFIKKPGYIYNFESFSWINFLKSAETARKKVLIKKEDAGVYECDLSLEFLYPMSEMEGESQYYFQIRFHNVHPVGNESDIQESGFDQSAVESQMYKAMTEKESQEPISSIQFGDETEESATPYETSLSFDDTAASPPQTPLVETQESIFSPGQEETESVPETLNFAEEEERSAAEEKENTSLEILDFSFEEKEEPSETEVETTPSISFDLPEQKEEENFVVIKEEESQTASSAENEAPSFTDFESTQPEERPSIELLPIESQEMEKIELSEKGSESTEEREVESQPGQTYTPQAPDIRRTAGALGLPETLVKNFLSEMLDEYKQSQSRRQKALEEGELEVLRKEAFRLKGIASNLLLDELTKVLETLTHADRPAMIEGWKRVDIYMQRVAETLKQSQKEVPTQELSQVTKEESETKEETPQKALLELAEDGKEPINFDPEEAAEALGLPASLIVEFANDFVQQAHEEKEIFQQAYAEGDLTKINETAHKLKGVAANLRIEEMRTLMEKVQYAETLEDAAEKLKIFYQKLGALRHTMKREHA